MNTFFLFFFVLLALIAGALCVADIVNALRGRPTSSVTLPLSLLVIVLYTVLYPLYLALSA